MIDLIVEQTNLYANRDKNMHNFKTDQDEMKTFLSLIYCWWISQFAFRKWLLEYCWWYDYANIFIYNEQRQVTTIKRYLHIADNSSLAQSKVAKILPLNELLKKKTVCNLVFFISFWALISQWFRIVDFTMLGSSSKKRQWNLAIKYGCCDILLWKRHEQSVSFRFPCCANTFVSSDQQGRCVQ